MYKQTISDKNLLHEFNQNNKYLYLKCKNENIDINVIKELSDVLYNAYIKSNDIQFSKFINSCLNIINEKYYIQCNKLTVKNINFLNNIFNMIILDYNKRRNI